MPEPLAWERDGPRWPLSASSRFVVAGGLRWHVQVLGPADAPVFLLLHGTGASTHSWRDLAPLLARDHRIVMPDLPGHAFTAMPPFAQMSLPGMAAGVAALLGTLGVAPRLVVGHSAGAAVGLRMALDGAIAPAAIVSLNGALLPPGGPVGQWLFSPLAKLFALNPLVPQVFAWTARDRRVLERLLDSTGSTLDATGAALYGRLVADPGHVAAALAMMAQWQLQPLYDDLPRLVAALHLVAADNDRTIPAADALRVARQVPGAQVHRLAGLGHLAHEERPDLVDALIRRIALG